VRVAASVVVYWFCVFVFACVCICVCARISVRERMCAYACVCPGMCAFVCARVHLFLQFCILARVCVCAARGCVGPPMGTGGIYSAACDARTAHTCVLRWRWPSVGSPRCGRRRDVDEPYDQRAVGCATFAHGRDRRRRRHLRHRRPRHRRRRRHLLQGRVGEHRRRCGPDSVGCWGSTGWVGRGY
jgi:hypothetical protein